VRCRCPWRSARSGEGRQDEPEKRLFGFSVLYLFALFAALVADRLILGQGRWHDPRGRSQFKRAGAGATSRWRWSCRVRRAVLRDHDRQIGAD
jgi:hypothetical protein